MVTTNSINWKSLRLVIFDVDGTLYDQSKLRFSMLLALMGHFIFRPWKYKDLLILYYFRKEREDKAGYSGENIKEQQYVWCSKKTGISVNIVKKVVDKWIFNAPNKYIARCMYPNVKEFFRKLHYNNVETAIYSDYDAFNKMGAMGLNVDLCVSSTDQHINAMKPLPIGLTYILDRLNINDKQTCIFIGDRYELDGKCAENAQIPFLIINKREAKDNFYLKVANSF